MDNKIDISILLEDYLEDASCHLDAVETILLQLESSSGEGEREAGNAAVTILLGNLHTLKGNSGMMGFSQLQQYIHKLESILKHVADGTLPLTASMFEAFYAAVSKMREAFNRLAENPSERLDFVDEIMLLECLISGTADEVEKLSFSQEKKEDFGYITRNSSMVKVNFEKLDDLLNLVGELVIHRTTLLNIEARLKESVKNRAIIEAFNEASQMIGKTSNDLREAIMRVRMLPVNIVFQRFNRLVRDLSRSHGKEITLVFEGKDTELDKTVIDEIGEPLLHLIRNSIDHGIESPAERQAKGKPRAGKIELQARHENNHIVITVKDDGRGISPGGLKETALAKGMIDGHQARTMTDQEALQLIFLPGFSTSRVLTEISGRGIGLDVVKKTVASFNGVIEIDSIQGAGTAFTIKLPLTLAIIPALMVEVSGESFAIPLSGVLESIKIDTAEIHEVSSGELIKLRDRLLPVVRLDRFFGLAEAAARDAEYVVVVGSGEKRGGIVVDRLIGQQEIVIKAMDDYLGELPGISGGTVLGDGRVSLILDIATLIGKNSKVAVAKGNPLN